MNIFEAFGAVFLAIVIINLVSMIWAIKKARMMESDDINAEQEA